MFTDEEYVQRKTDRDLARTELETQIKALQEKIYGLDGHQYDDDRLYYKTPLFG